MSRSACYLLLIGCLLCITSCKKASDSTEKVFYGQWKSSYGETISFERKNGKNILTSVYSISSSALPIQPREYRYTNDKLELSLSPGAPGYQTLQSFTWVQEGKEFTLQGTDWHPFLSSTITIYTFKKL